MSADDIRKARQDRVASALTATNAKIGLFRRSGPAAPSDAPPGSEEEDPPSIAIGKDLRDFADQPITADEMAAAVERAHRDHLAQGEVADLHAVLLQEASKALRRAGAINAAATKAQANLEATRRILDDALRSKPDGRDL